MKQRIFLLVIILTFVGSNLSQQSTHAIMKITDQPSAIFPWINEVIDQDKAVGEHVSVAIDQNDKTFISYYDGDNQDLRMTTFVGTGGNCGENLSWWCEIVDTRQLFSLVSVNGCWLSIEEGQNDLLQEAEKGFKPESFERIL